MADLPRRTDGAGEERCQEGGSEVTSAPSLPAHAPSSRLALDIGGSLIKLVYLSKEDGQQSSEDGRSESLDNISADQPPLRKTGRSLLIPGGRLHFLTFETSKLNECLDFISRKQLHRSGSHSRQWCCRDQNLCVNRTIVKATGGGAYKFADLFKEKLSVKLGKEDEMDCLVAGTSFLLKTIPEEAFMHMKGQKQFVKIDQNNLFPYLLVNIGSGVSMIKVDGEREFQRVSGTSLGGGTFWGLGRLLTKCKSFDELLEMSLRGSNSNVDMLIGDLDGCLDHSKIGLSATTIASSFGKATSNLKDLSDYKHQDIALALLLMITYNIGQISYLVARHYGIKRILFGGFFIRGHACTMDALSFAVHFWSKGQAKAMFLQNEGFLGVLGAFMNYERNGLGDSMPTPSLKKSPMTSCINRQANNSSLGTLQEKAIHGKDFLYKGHKEFRKIDDTSFFPYLLVNIGSGVSMIKVNGYGKFQRVTGTNIGGGTYWGLGRLLTKCKSFDDLLELSKQGNNTSVDMLVGDIYGGLDYSKIGLSASTIASSFGKTISESKELPSYRSEDMSVSLLRMISYNIAQISYFTAAEHGLEMIVFSGDFIRGHDYTMETISVALRYWSGGLTQAVFLQHEGVLRALGVFTSSKKNDLDDLLTDNLIEKFTMGSAHIIGQNRIWRIPHCSEKERKFRY